MKTLIVAFAGALAGVLFVLSCSDDSPGMADAATCDCPPAEPPLEGRIVTVRQTGTLPPLDIVVLSPTCDVGATLLGGGCTSADSSIPDIVIQQSGFVEAEPRSYFCFLKNNTNQPVQVAATARCLNPAP